MTIPESSISDPKLPRSWLVAFRRTGSARDTFGEHVGPQGRPTSLRLRRAPEDDVTVAEDGGRVVVFSGRLYAGVESLRAVRAARLVAEIVRDGGESGLRALRGTFVVLVWDVDRGSLLAMRDQIGYYPLFVAESSGLVLVAQAQEELLRHGVAKDVDAAAVAGWIAERPLDGRRTFFSAITRVPPGHWLRAGADGASRLERYWVPVVPEEPEPCDPAEAWERFDALLCRSVDRCLDLGRAGVYLSGGVDSITIAAVAAERARLHGHPVPWALALGGTTPESDESPTQRAAAEALGLPLFYATGHEAAGSVSETLRRSTNIAVPIQGPGADAFDLLDNEGADRGCRAFLGGQGSEWLRGPPDIAADYLRSVSLGRWWRLVQAERAHYAEPFWITVRRLAWRSGTRHLVRDVAGSALAGRRRQRTAGSLSSWIAPRDGLRTQLVDGLLEMDQQGPQTGSQYRRNRLRLLDHPYMTIPMDTYWNPAVSGVTHYDPFQDADLVELLLRLPPAHLWFGRHVKGLAAESIRRRAPRFDLRLISRASYEVEIETMLAREGSLGLRQTGGFPILAELGVVEPRTVGHALEQGVFSADVRYSSVWHALAMEAWLQARLRTT